MKLNLKIAKILQLLIAGHTIAASQAKSKIIDDLVFENILISKGKHRKTIELLNENDLRVYLANQLQIFDLEQYVKALENQNATRADLVKVSTDSKKSKERAFKGFLINCYQSIEIELNNKKTTIHPIDGSFVFIYDFESFKIPENITVVGVENAKNFRQIQQQKYLFEEITPMFISRYPQSQSKDFINWIKSVPNNYMHFGDFDLAGIGIYLNEYKKHLAEKAQLFIPKNIAIDIRQNGNRVRYNKQHQNFKTDDIQEPNIKELLQLIHLEQKGLDQEFYING